MTGESVPLNLATKGHTMKASVIICLRRCLLASSIIAGIMVVDGCDWPASPDAPANLLVAQDHAPDSSTAPRYELRAKHDPNGTGKFYMGREIAQMMGPGGIEWLDRTAREEEEHPAIV